MNTSQTKIRYWILVLAVVLGCLLTRERAADHFIASQEYENLYYLPGPEWLASFSLGFREAAADGLWIQALIYFGEEVRQQKSAEHIFRFAESIIELDPDFARIYRWVAATSLYRPMVVPVEDIEAAVEVLQLGVDRFPNDPELVWDLGATLSYELAPRLNHDREYKARVKERGSIHLVRAARMGAGPAWAALSNASQLLRLGQNEQAIRHLEEMYSVTRSADLRYSIARQLANLRDETHAEALEQAYREHEEEWMANYPYMPSTFYQILGPRPEYLGGADDAVTLDQRAIPPAED
jgi:tetratricopeptide (TPR) repeat protein